MARPVGTPFEGPVTNLLLSLVDGIMALKYQGEEFGYIFKTLPDRKTPDYYKIIQNPTSLTIIKTNLRKGRYSHPNYFITDLAQVVWNAKTYNVKNSLVYNYANVIEQYIKTYILPTMHSDPHLQRYAPLIDYPNLGPLPEELGEGQHFNQPKRQPIPIISSPQSNLGSPTNNNNAITKFGNTPVITNSPYNSLTPQPPNGYNPDLTYEAWCKRGRPPIIDRPYEQRIKNIMRSVKKIRNKRDEFIHLNFDRLPDQKDYPEYYQIIKNPICLDQIKVKIRQRSYINVEQFVDDLKLVIDNSKIFNSINSKLLDDTLLLEKKIDEFIKEEINKPDSAYMPADGSQSLKIPLDHVEVNGKTYKVGDWILIRNPNDENKPIVAQLFRIWQTQDGKRWVNGCWYYRPEQTVHRVDRLFYLNEVCKSGQYRDHLADEIVGHCYVAYFTRYQRGDPGVQYEGPLFVCEFRYNDTDKGFNKIRTWKACLPDEVRHIEDPIIPLSSLRVMPKIESPLKHLLPPNATYNDPIPDPTLGHPNAPPLIGAVYKRPPDPKDDLGQYSTSINPNKNNIPKNISNVKNITTVPLSQNAAVAAAANFNNNNSPPPMDYLKNHDQSIMSYLPINGTSLSPQINDANSLQVHHANANYSSMNSNFTYTLPESIESQIPTSANYYRMDDLNVERRGDFKTVIENDEEIIEDENDIIKKNPIIWYTSPPIHIISKIQSSEVFNIGKLSQKTRKRLIPIEEEIQEENEPKLKNRRKSRTSNKNKDEEKELINHDHHKVVEEIVDSPGYGNGWGIQHSAKYLAWKLSKVS